MLKFARSNVNPKITFTKKILTYYSELPNYSEYTRSEMLIKKLRLSLSVKISL